MVKTISSVQLRRRWDLAWIHRYMRQHDECTTPALRRQLLARGYDPQLVDQVLAEGAHAPSRLVPFLLGCAVVLLINLWIHAYYHDYWLWTLMGEGLALGGFLTAGDDPMVEARWSWSARPEDLSDQARLHRRQERGVVCYLSWGIAAGVLGSILFVLLW